MPAGLIEGLATEGIYVAPRLGRMRISPHVSTTSRCRPLRCGFGKAAPG